MKLRKRRLEEPEIGLTSLIDVVFLLLIFFMVTTTFRKQSAFDITLPKVSRQVQEQQATLVVSIDAAGRFAVDGHALPATDLTTLKTALAAAMRGHRHPTLEIRADGRTPNQAVVQTLDAAGQLGLQHISIAAQPGSTQ